MLVKFSQIHRRARKLRIISKHRVIDDNITNRGEVSLVCFIWYQLKCYPIRKGLPSNYTFFTSNANTIGMKTFEKFKHLLDTFLEIVKVIIVIML